jgi:hypothetical protein
MAGRMAARFGAGILAVIQTEPGRLVGVHGLGPKRTKKIAGAWSLRRSRAGCGCSRAGRRARAGCGRRWWY